MTHDRSSHIRDRARMFVRHHRWVIFVCLFVCELYSLVQTFGHSAFASLIEALCLEWIQLANVDTLIDRSL